MLAAVEGVVTDNQVRDQVMSCIKSVPMSDTVHQLQEGWMFYPFFQTLLVRLRKADVMSLAVDESTDNSDTAQLCLFVRFFDGNCFTTSWS